jgi:CheY-like chemotaxis protein
MSRTILLADDSVTIQKVIELTFMEEDYEVVAAGDGDEALERLDEQRPDFVIADVHMPGASGIDVCRRSKQLYPEVPVLLLVGTFEPFDEAEARAAGADAHLKKPFDSQELLQLVDDLMGPEEAAAPAATDSAAAAPQDGDSTWGFDVDGETGEPPGEPEWAVPVAEPEPEPEPEWAASPSPPEPEPEWAAPIPEEPEWAAEPSAAEGRSEPEPAGGPVGGDDEWGPLDPQPAEVTPPAVGQAEVGEPVWDRSAAPEPFQLGEVEPRHRDHEEVFDLGAGAGAEAAVDDSEAAVDDSEAFEEPGAASGSSAGPGWGFALEEGETKHEPAPSADGVPAPLDGDDADRAVPAAGFRWDEPEDPGSLVIPPDEPYKASAEEPSWGEPSWVEPEPTEPEPTEPEATEPEPTEPEPTEPEAVEPEAVEPEPTEPEPTELEATEPEAEPDATAAAPSWGEPGAEFESFQESPEAAAEPIPAEPEEAEPSRPAAPVPGSGASYGGAEVTAPPAAELPAPAAPAGGLSEGDVERIARRVAELVGERVTREVAWEVVPDLAEVVIRERLRELEGQID